MKPRSVPSLAVLSLLSLGVTAGGQIQFQPGVSYSTGQSPAGVALADFNGDGNRDIAVTSDTPDQVSVMLGVGDGTFGAPLPVFQQAGSGPQALIAADFDRDGDMDLAVSLQNQNQIALLTNQGAGVFNLAGTTAVGAEPRAMDSADFNNDGQMDLVVSERSGNSVSVLLNNGAGFSATSFAAGNDPRFVTAGDFTGDGLADVAVSVHDDRSVRVFRNMGGGALTVMADLSVGPTVRPDGITSGDLDGDGDVDLSVAVSDDAPVQNFAAVFLNNGGFSTFQSYPFGGQGSSGMLAADFDLDCDLDLAAANQDSNDVSVLPQTAGGVFGAGQRLAAGTTTEDVDSADLDGNGSPDLVAVNRDSNSLTVYLNQADARLTDLGQGLAGSQGVPQLAGIGTLCLGNEVTLTLSSAASTAPAFLIVGLSQLGAPFAGGTMVPSIDLIFGRQTNAAGALELGGPVLSAPPTGQSLFFQFWIVDPAGPQGFSASNALQAITP